jgi:cytochrome c oxidase subunit 4/cytochrome o ubiquinol oxidase operon protein cyoD
VGGNLHHRLFDVGGVSMANHEAHGEHHEAHAEHSTRFYWMVGLILAIVTAVEVAIFLVQEWFSQEVFLISLMVLMLAKGVGVVLYFMHIKDDDKIFQFMFVVPFVLAVSLVLVMLTLFSGHVGIAG